MTSETFKGKVIWASDFRSAGKGNLMEFVLDSQNGKMVLSLWGEQRGVDFIPKVGQEVVVKVFFTAREWNGKWYNGITVQSLRGVPNESGFVPDSSPVMKPNEDFDNGVDDLPF